MTYQPVLRLLQGGDCRIKFNVITKRRRFIFQKVSAQSMFVLGKWFHCFFVHVCFCPSFHDGRGVKQSFHLHIPVAQDITNFKGMHQRTEQAWFIIFLFMQTRLESIFNKTHLPRFEITRVLKYLVAPTYYLMATSYYVMATTYYLVATRYYLVATSY